MLELQHLNINAVVESPMNTRKRFNPEKMAELTESIKAQGVLQPILVRPVKSDNMASGLYEIVAGARRYRAAKSAELDAIPAVIRELDDTQALEANLIENLQRDDVHPIEEAEGYQLLMDGRKYNADQLAEKVGKSRSYIYGRLKLLDLCHDVRDAFFDSKLDASTALLIARIPGKTLQKGALKKILTGYAGAPMSYRAAKDFVLNDYTADLSDAKFDPKAKTLTEAGSCTDCPKRSGANPELFTDIENVNVCTDTNCFKDKTTAHWLNLKEKAIKRGVQVLEGKAAKEIMPNGPYSMKDTEMISLDSPCWEDDKGRTYRQILGKAAPITHLIENDRAYGKQSKYIEAATPGAIEEALQKAGIKFDSEPEETEDDDQPDEQEKAFEIEKHWRVKLFERVRAINAERLHKSQSIPQPEMRALAEGLYRMRTRDENYVADVEKMWGHQPADEMDDQARIDDFVATIINAMDETSLCQILFDLAFIDQVTIDRWAYRRGHQATLLIAEAKRLGLDVEAMRAQVEAELYPAVEPAEKVAA